MSIEKKIDELIAALNANTEAVKAAGNAPAAATSAPKADKPKADKPKTEKPKAEPTPEPETAEGDDAAGDLTYEDVKTATIATSKAKGREFVAGVLSQFGKHESAKTLAPEQWADYLEALKADAEDDMA